MDRGALMVLVPVPGDETERTDVACPSRVLQPIPLPHPPPLPFAPSSARCARCAHGRSRAQAQATARTPVQRHPRARRLPRCLRHRRPPLPPVPPHPLGQRVGVGRRRGQRSSPGRSPGRTGRTWKTETCSAHHRPLHRALRHDCVSCLMLPALA